MSECEKSKLRRYEQVLESLQKKPCAATAADRILVQWFLEVTKAEDEWLVRDAFINESPAAMVRSLLIEVGEKHELSAAFDFYRLRPALHAFAEGESFPMDLVPIAAVSVKYWRAFADICARLELYPEEASSH